MGQSDEHIAAVRAFRVLDKMWTLWDRAAAIRLSVSTHGDFSKSHQGLVEKFYNTLADEFTIGMVAGSKSGLSYMMWPDHYLACHLSDDMRTWAELSGGIPFGRLSNQVSEHMNKKAKGILEHHTSDGVSIENINRSKFKQCLRWLCIERWFPQEVGAEAIRTGSFCRKCVQAGLHQAAGWVEHYRVTFKQCPLFGDKAAAAAPAPMTDTEQVLLDLEDAPSGDSCDSDSGSDSGND